jgi:hypothetical protein
MRLSFFLLLFISVFLWQCDGKTPSQDTAEAETTTPAPETIVSAETPTNPYPSVTQEIMMNLYDNCDYIDFVFYTTNFSMSQNQQNAIRSTLAGISTQPAQVFPSCQPVGRVFFQIKGENAEEADLFYGGNCLYYLFLEDGTYTYGNQLAKSGYDFYQKIFAQAAASGGQ